jgi:hypothetical protein
MRPEIAAADRKFLVRRAASAWRKAGELDAAAEAGIAALYADDRVRTSKIFRILFFVFTWFGFSTAYGFGLAFVSVLGIDWDDTAAFCALNMFAGAAMLAAAEFLTGTMKLRRFGIEEACVWIGWGYLLGGGLWWLLEGFDAGPGLLLVVGAWAAAGLATLIVWRWATPGMGAIAALASFAALSQAPANHLVWLLAAGLLAWPLGALSVAPHVSPEHRKRFAEAFVVVVAMLYFAVHVAVVEARLFTLAGWIDDPSVGQSLRAALAEAPVGAMAVGLSLAAMVALPVALLWVGVRRRFRPALALGLLAALVTAVSLADRLDLRPIWLGLVVGGAALVGLALLARRFFASRSGSEWSGLTTLPLAEDRESAGTLEVAAVLVTLSPAARQPEPGGFEGGGGEFGGGGASAKF